jgi:hypothetical protein
MSWLGNIINNIKKSTRARYVQNIENNAIQLLLNSDDERYFTLEFDKINIKNQSSTHFQRASYIEAKSSKFGDVLIQMIELNAMSSFETSASSMYETYLRQEFGDLELENIETRESKYTKFVKYQTKASQITGEIGTIYICLNNIEVLIVDCGTGVLFNDMLKIYDFKNIENIKINNPINQKHSFNTDWEVFNMKENIFTRDM